MGGPNRLCTDRGASVVRPPEQSTPSLMQSAFRRRCVVELRAPVGPPELPRLVVGFARGSVDGVGVLRGVVLSSGPTSAGPRREHPMLI